MKHTISIFASLILSLCISAAGVEIGGICYVLDRANYTASVTYRVWPKNGTDPIAATSLYTGKVVIPTEVTYLDTTYRVTKIGDNAFFGSKRMTSVTIPNTVTSVGYMAFAWCSGLKELTFPESITSMGQYMFTGDMGNVNVACMALTPPAVSGYDLGTSLTIHVPYEVIPRYQNTLGWYRHPIQSILFESERLADGSVNLTWLPVATVDTYQLCVEAYMASALVYADTFYIAADSQNGGIAAATSAPSRRMPTDEIGTVVVISIVPGSGAAVGQPFMVNVSAAQAELITCRVKLLACNNGQVVKQDQILFSFNDEDTALEDIPLVNALLTNPNTVCFDLHGRRHPISSLPSLPTGVYILREGGVARKIMK